MLDIHNEFDQLRRKHGVEGRFAMKKVTRKYAFEQPGVPQGESEWYKIVYGFDRESWMHSCKWLDQRDADHSIGDLRIEPQLPESASGATFSKIFGTNTSAFEMLVIKRKIMGPCWLEIKGCSTVSTKPVSGAASHEHRQI